MSPLPPSTPLGQGQWRGWHFVELAENVTVISFMTFGWNGSGGGRIVSYLPHCRFVEIKMTVKSDQNPFGFTYEFRVFSVLTVHVVISPVSKVPWSYRTMINLRVYFRYGAFLYVPHSFLLISNKLCNGGSSAVLLLKSTSAKCYLTALEGWYGPWNLPKIPIYTPLKSPVGSCT